MSSGKGGVDSQPIGGFKNAFAKYQNTSTDNNSQGATKAKKAAAKSSGSTSGSTNGSFALFASINSGATGSLTTGLNKVTSDMKTKNRKDRSGKVAASTKKSAYVGKKDEKKEDVKDAVTTVSGNTIRVNYYNKMTKLLVFGSDANDAQEKIDDPYTPEEMKIYDHNKIDLKYIIEFWNCKDAMFRVSKKCKAVKLYNCDKIQISVKAVLSTIEVTNCNRVTIFVKEKAPSILVEKCDGVKIWLDEKVAAMDPPPQIYTTLAQNTELNVSQGDDKDPLSVPVPSQFVTQIVDGKWKTEPVSHV